MVRPARFSAARKSEENEKKSLWSVQSPSTFLLYHSGLYLGHPFLSPSSSSSIRRWRAQPLRSIRLFCGAPRMTVVVDGRDGGVSPCSIHCTSVAFFQFLPLLYRADVQLVVFQVGNFRVISNLPTSDWPKFGNFYGLILFCDYLRLNFIQI